MNCPLYINERHELIDGVTNKEHAFINFNEQNIYIYIY